MFELTCLVLCLFAVGCLVAYHYGMSVEKKLLKKMESEFLHQEKSKEQPKVIEAGFMTGADKAKLDNLGNSIPLDTTSTPLEDPVKQAELAQYIRERAEIHAEELAQARASEAKRRQEEVELLYKAKTNDELVHTVGVLSKECPSHNYTDIAINVLKQRVEQELATTEAAVQNTATPVVRQNSRKKSKKKTKAKRSRN